MLNKNILKRLFILMIGLFFSALGVAVTKQGKLGISPVSSVANIMNLRFPSVSLGTWLILWNCSLIAGQILILRTNFNWLQLAQLPLSFLFGTFTDLGVLLVSSLPNHTYLQQLILVLAGILLCGLGVSFVIAANIIMNSGDAFVKAFSDTWHIKFGYVKTSFDIACVVLAAILSLCFFHFSIQEIREGTLLSALLTGVSVQFFSNLTKKPLANWLSY